MPATKPAGGEDPVVKTISTNPAIKKWFTDRLLILVTAIFLLVILFIGLSPLGKSSLQKFLKPKEVAKPEFSGLAKITESAKENADKQKSYQAYKVLFEMQRQQYYEDGQSRHRQDVEKTAADTKTAFANEFKDYDFVVPCLDDGCQVLTYVPSIKDIAPDVQSEQGIADNLRRASIASLRVFSYYSQDTPPAVLYASYDQLFHNLVSFYQIGKSEKIKADIEKVLLLMKTSNQAQFEFFNKLGFYKY